MLSFVRFLKTVFGTKENWKTTMMMKKGLLLTMQKDTAQCALLIKQQKFLYHVVILLCVYRVLNNVVANAVLYATLTLRRM